MVAPVVVLFVWSTVDSGSPWLWGAASSAILPIESGDRYGEEKHSTAFFAFLANTPQIFLSFWYLSANGLCTSMAGAEEWNNLASSKPPRGLRVSSPKGLQRSKYFLQLPYRWAGPLLVWSIMLHWLLSQSFFLVVLEGAGAKSACGVSYSSLVTFCVFAVGLLLAVLWFAYISRMNVLLPPIRASSLMISAACHPLSSEVDPHLKPVRWRAILEADAGGPPRYSLSSALDDEMLSTTQKTDANSKDQQTLDADDSGIRGATSVAATGTSVGVSVL